MIAAPATARKHFGPRRAPSCAASLCPPQPPGEGNPPGRPTNSYHGRQRGNDGPGPGRTADGARLLPVRRRVSTPPPGTGLSCGRLQAGQSPLYLPVPHRTVRPPPLPLLEEGRPPHPARPCRGLAGRRAVRGDRPHRPHQEVGLRGPGESVTAPLEGPLRPAPLADLRQNIGGLLLQGRGQLLFGERREGYHHPRGEHPHVLLAAHDLALVHDHPLQQV